MSAEGGAETSKPTRTWSGWFEQAQSQAKEIATKAQSIAETAGKAVVVKANELRENYDIDTATTILMSTLGTASNLDAVSEPQASTPSKQKSAIKLNQLDLVYVTENVIAMAFPFDPKKPGNAEGGNDINAVSIFLKKKHGGHFMIWNVSEEGYDYSLFGDQVLEYKFPGHPAPPLGLLFKICTSVESWLDADDRNIAVAHCLTGKGRTAALTACILTWIGEFSSPMEALQYVADRRGISVEYLTIPSQRRYVQYFSNMLDGVKPRSEPLLLRRVIINSIPVFGDNAGGPSNLGCCPYVQLFKGGRLIATAAPPPDPDSSQSSATEQFEAKTQQQRLQLKWVKASEGSASFQVDCAVQGDILLRCRHADCTGARVSMFRAAFHTGYVPCGVLRLTKAQLDGACSDPRFDDDFFIDLIFAPIEKAQSASAASSTATAGTTGTGASVEMAVGGMSPAAAGLSTVGVPTDQGLVIDSMSSDRYELSLHRDTRFWDAVAARKSKSKKRRSRKFLSTSQDQFSISDDLLGSGDSSEGEITFSAIKASQIVKPSNVAGLSDAELIMQLARAEGDSGQDGLGAVDPFLVTPASDSSLGGASASALGSGAGSGAGTTSSGAGIVEPAGTANDELQALEDLERELGLDDLQLFRMDSTPASASMGGGGGGSSGSLGEARKAGGEGGDKMASGVGGSAGAVDESDELDELEKYLQSLSSS